MALMGKIKQTNGIYNRTILSHEVNQTFSPLHLSQFGQCKIHDNEINDVTMCWPNWKAGAAKIIPGTVDQMLAVGDASQGTEMDAVSV
jgi:hypothetical protein